jgi:hypothetical protein
MQASPTELINTRSTLRPKFFYHCKSNKNKLHRVDLLTGEQSCHKIPSYHFKAYCRWSELPGGSLLVTGGRPAVREVVLIDTNREWAVCSQPPMHTARGFHAAVYHSQYLYVLAGYSSGTSLSECERYVCAESRWEVLPALLVAGCAMSAVVQDSTLYALGGNAGRFLDSVQKLSLNSLTWELMQLRLPQAARFIPCFKTDSQVLLVINDNLYSFTPFEVKLIKSLPLGIIDFNSSYYSRGTLYYDDSFAVRSLAIGELA